MMRVFVRALRRLYLGGKIPDEKIRELCHLDGTARLVITLGYPAEGDKLRDKKRKSLAELVDFQ